MLFVGDGGGGLEVLAQDTNDFHYDQAGNKLKSKDRIDTDSSNFGVGSGNVSGNSSGNSGTTTIDTGSGSPNTSGSLPAGNSGAVTVITGVGGSSDNGSAPGNSGNLNLKTGSGGGNAFAGASGGNAGHIILQPGSGGSGPGGTGSGGSTIVRASNSGDILAVQNSAGTTTHLGVANNGNIRAGAPSSSARLHLGAGTSTLPPLKFTSGTLLTTRAAGAMEFDGTDLFITLSNARRRFLTSHVANVLDFGAKGDGSTDDAQPVKDAVASLVTTGGVIWFPPHLVYKISSSIDIRSFFPIWIVSEMGHGPVMDDFGAQGPALGKGYIKVGGPITDGMFRWRAPATGATYPEEAGGGGVRHVHIVDEPLNIANHLGRNHAIDAAVFVEGCQYFMVDDCWFSFLKGTAIKVGRVTVCRVNFGRICRCGNTNKPAVHVFGDGAGAYGAARVFDLVLEGTHLAPSVKIEPGTTAIIQRTHFEANASEAELQQTFVHCSGTCTLLENGFGALGDNVTQVIYDGTGNLPFQRITGNVFKGIGTALVMGSAYSQADISGNFFNGAGSTSNIDAVTINGQICKLANNRFYATGRINLTNNRAEFLNNSVISGTAPSGSALVVCGNYSQIRDNFFDGGGTTAVPAIKPNGSAVKVDNNFIRGLNNVTAIDMSAAIVQSSLTDNTAIELNGGTAFTYSSGLTAWGNFGYPTAATASAGAATLHAESGVITSEALTTAAGSSYTLTLTNQLIAATSRVQVSVSRGTEADSLSYQIQEVRPQAGSCVIVIKNTGSVPFGDAGAGAGTIKIAFSVQN